MLRIASLITTSEGPSALTSAAHRKCALISPATPGSAASLAAWSRRATDSAANSFTRAAARVLKP
jgi:hypothetical protein